MWCVFILVVFVLLCFDLIIISFSPFLFFSQILHVPPTFLSLKFVASFSLIVVTYENMCVHMRLHASMLMYLFLFLTR